MQIKRLVVLAIIASFLPLSSPVAYSYDDDYDNGYAYNDDGVYYDGNGGQYYSEDGYRQPHYYQHKKQGHWYVASSKNYKKKNRKYSSGGSMPSQIPAPGQKVIIVNPNIHAWGAYSPDGTLLRSGLATAGNSWCPDIHRSCRTRAGTFRIFSLGGPGCKSSKYPLPRGGAPMPYCMFFNGNQGLHGSHEVVAANVSHGCVRLRVDDAAWIRYNFANIGTKVIVKPY